MMPCSFSRTVPDALTSLRTLPFLSLYFSYAQKGVDGEHSVIHVECLRFDPGELVALVECFLGAVLYVLCSILAKITLLPFRCLFWLWSVNGFEHHK